MTVETDVSICGETADGGLSYRDGEMERVALATMNGELRHENNNLRDTIEGLNELVRTLTFYCDEFVELCEGMVIHIAELGGYDAIMQAMIDSYNKEMVES